MEKLEKINIDWKKRFKNLKVGTSAIKSLIRFDWTKESRQRKDNYNKEVEFVSELAQALTEDYNTLAKTTNELNDQYTADYNEVFARIDKALQDSNSIQSQLKKFSENVNRVSATIDKSNANFSRAGINIKNCKYTKVLPLKYKEELKRYQNRIDIITKPLNELKREMEVLKNSKNKSEKLLQTLQRQQTAEELKLATMSAMQPFDEKPDRVSSISGIQLTLASLNSQIATATINISRLENNIRDNAKQQEPLKKSLSKLDEEITEFSNLLISEGLKSIREFVETSKQNITAIWTEIKTLQATVNNIAKYGNIFTMDEIAALNNDVKRCFKEINASAKLADISDKKKDYGEGFFRTISTKEKKLDELKHTFLKIKSDLLKYFNQIKTYTTDMSKKRNSSEEAWNISAIEVQLANAENQFKDFEQKTRMFHTAFNKSLSKTDIHAIKLFYNDDGLLKSVAEVLITL